MKNEKICIEKTLLYLILAIFVFATVTVVLTNYLTRQNYSTGGRAAGTCSMWRIEPNTCSNIPGGRYTEDTTQSYTDSSGRVNHCCMALRTPTGSNSSLVNCPRDTYMTQNGCQSTCTSTCKTCNQGGLTKYYCTTGTKSPTGRPTPKPTGTSSNNGGNNTFCTGVCASDCSRIGTGGYTVDTAQSNTCTSGKFCCVKTGGSAGNSLPMPTSTPKP